MTREGWKDVEKRYDQGETLRNRGKLGGKEESHKCIVYPEMKRRRTAGCAALKRETTAAI